MFCVTLFNLFGPKLFISSAMMLSSPDDSYFCVCDMSDFVFLVLAVLRSLGLYM